MSDRNPYAPPSSNPEAPAVARAPRAFIVLLGAYLLLSAASAVFGGSIFSAIFLVIVGIAAWRTVQGGQAASRYLGGLLILGVIVSVRAVASMWASNPPGAMVSAAVAVYQSILVGYIFLSPGMRALYTKAERAKWTER
jgi:Na+/phosphate symporter